MRISVTNQKINKTYSVDESTFNKWRKKTYVNAAGQTVPLFVANGNVVSQERTTAPVQKKSPVAPVKRQTADSEIKLIAQKIEEIEKAETVEQVDEIIKGQQNFNVLITGERKKNEFLVIAVAKAYDEMTALHNGMTALTETNNALNKTIGQLKSQKDTGVPPDGKPSQSNKNPMTHDKTT